MWFLLELSVINSVLLGMTISLIWTSRRHPIQALKEGIVPHERFEEFRSVVYTMLLINIGVVVFLTVPIELLWFTPDQLAWLRLCTRLMALAYLVWATRLVVRFIIDESLLDWMDRHTKART